jgi:hypothetical protein
MSASVPPAKPVHIATPPIRGHYFVPGVISLTPYEPPRHCHDCGKAFPWTAQAMPDPGDELRDVEATEWAAANYSYSDPQHLASKWSSLGTVSR